MQEYSTDKFLENIIEIVFPNYLTYTQKGDPQNYLPVSFLRLVLKIIKKSIHFQFEDNLHKKKLINMYQPSLRTNHSTDFCLAQLIDFLLTGMDKQMHIGITLVYLKKVLDTNILSEFNKVIYSVPQGSIVGRILFNCFFNDFYYFIKNANVHNFCLKCSNLDISFGI